MNQRSMLMLSISICFWAGSLRAQPGDGPGPGMMDGPPGGRPGFDQMVRELNLSKEQQEKAKALRDKRGTVLKAQSDKLRPLHDELRKLLESDKVDLTRVRQQLRIIGDVIIEIRMLEIEGRLEFESILTKEQMAKLRDLHRRQMERMGPRTEHGPEGER